MLANFLQGANEPVKRVIANGSSNSVQQVGSFCVIHNLFV
jgi:hypothetical protein